ncbi:MAG: hypothetical protein ACLQM8_20820 [Limisphaerales bacterium]
MKHIGFTLWLAVALLVASIAAPMAIWRHAQARWLEQDGLRREQEERLTGLSTENHRLSKLAEQAQGPSPSDEQLRGLLKLRGQIGLLRRMAGEADQLRATNQQLEAARANSSRQLSAPLPGAAIIARWPKGQLAVAGYADPASALETALCAMSRGDANLLAASVTPEAKRRMTREDWVGAEHGPAADEIAASTRNIADSLSPSGAFYLVGQKLTAEDQAILDVYFDAEGKTRKFAFEKIGAEWKLKAMGAAGGEDGDLGAPVWP